MRTLLRKLSLDILSLNSTPSKYVHILNGHFIEEIGTVVTLKILEDLIINLKYHFDIIKLNEAINLIQNKSFINRPKLSLTFDDGFLECYTQMLPIFEKYNIKATFFINPMSIENQDENFASSFIKNNLRVELSKKFMTWDMIREIQSLGHIIGSHTFSHANLKGILPSELQKEIVQSKVEIESATGDVCNYFAFPFGNQNYFDKNSVNLVNQTYDYSFTSGLYGNYFFEEDKQILSRRHFECNWPINHIKYFTSGKRELNLKL